MKTRLFIPLVLFVAAVSFAQDTPTSTLKKGIIPLVGSTPGAYGANFKTSLRLTPLGGAHGRIVFHPLGRIASDSDPSIPYSFPENARLTDSLVFDDIVAAMGQTGLGTLDIIPDVNGSNIVPPASARIYNDTPDGTFGTDEQVVYPLTYFVNPYGQPPTKGIAALHANLYVPALSSRFRRNIGFRTLSKTQLTAYIMHKDGSQEAAPSGFFPGDFSLLMSVEDFAQRLMGGKTIGPDDALVVWAMTGQAILYYTYTDNGTNDPSLVVTPAVEQNIMLADVPQ